jgi:hypothetical protein
MLMLGQQKFYDTFQRDVWSLQETNLLKATKFMLPFRGHCLLRELNLFDLKWLTNIFTSIFFNHALTHLNILKQFCSPRGLNSTLHWWNLKNKKYYIILLIHTFKKLVYNIIIFLGQQNYFTINSEAIIYHREKLLDLKM